MAVYTTIDDPEAHFRIKLYTGNGTDDTGIVFDTTDTTMQPDLVWIKNRNSTNEHNLANAVSQATKYVHANLDQGETTAANSLQSFDSNGFTLGTNANFNTNTNTYVAWCWKANNSSGASNTDGYIETLNAPNTTAGFSITTYTGDGVVRTLGHGLGGVPEVMMIKRRDATADWAVYHHKNTSAPQTDALVLNETDATADSAGYWNDVAPTSTVLTIGDNTSMNGSAGTYILLCWRSIQGYSKMGYYTGDGNADGPFIYMGFKPAMVIYKRTDSTANWSIFDHKRSVFNQISHQLNPNINDAEGDSDRGDFVSNGWKIRATAGSTNADGGTYIYMAFAESPFVNSNGVPNNAR